MTTPTNAPTLVHNPDFYAGDNPAELLSPAIPTNPDDTTPNLNPEAVNLTNAPAPKPKRPLSTRCTTATVLLARWLHPDHTPAGITPNELLIAKKIIFETKRRLRAGGLRLDGHIAARLNDYIMATLCAMRADEMALTDFSKDTVDFVNKTHERLRKSLDDLETALPKPKPIPEKKKPDPYWDKCHELMVTDPVGFEKKYGFPPPQFGPPLPDRLKPLKKDHPNTTNPSDRSAPSDRSDKVNPSIAPTPSGNSVVAHSPNPGIHSG